MAKKILIVEDEKNIVDILSFNLTREGYTALEAYDGEAGLQLALEQDPDLILLDLMLPRKNGFDVCRAIRDAGRTTPIIMLTAREEETDKVLGLELGADDYITKPFRPLELVARVKAQLRRYKHYNSGSGKTDDIISCSGLSLNVKTHECTLNERPLTLTPTEFSILCILCSHKGNVVSAEELFHQVWGDEYFNKSNNTITVHIRHLREKMGDSFEEPKYIKTVWGCGYKIEA